jgi:hypothetical protein
MVVPICADGEKPSLTPGEPRRTVLLKVGMRRAYAGLFLALWGCDPTRGLADTADAALPNQKRYFDGAGTQLMEGPWSRVVVDLDADTLYHVGARRTDDPEPTFHLFGADAQSGCQVSPNAGTWLMSKPAAAPFRLLPFVEDLNEHGRGTLRFTTLDCEVQELAIEDAGPPSPGLYDRGYLVPTKQGYTFADPWSGESREVATKLSRFLLWSDRVLLWADDALKSFSAEFEPGSEWGNTPVAVIGVRNDFLVEDADGLHRVTLNDSLAIEAESVLDGACHLQQFGGGSWDGNGVWLVLEQPCGDPHPTIVHLDAETFETLDTIELPFEADARHARARVPSAEASEAMPLLVLYLTDVDVDGLGTLWSWQAGADAPVKVAERGSLDALSLAPAGDEWLGSAQVNHQKIGSYDAYDWIHFRADGTSEVVAAHVVRNPSNGEQLANFDGVAGDLLQFDDDSFRVVAEGVPPYSSAVVSYAAGEPHYARVDHFDGNSGRVRLGNDADDLTAWAVVAEGVPPSSPRFAWFMPALLFIEGWDPATETGSLVAYNYELDARTTIAERVSSFDLTSYPWDGVLYTVPKGKQRGIWFSKAK